MKKSSKNSTRPNESSAEDDLEDDDDEDDQEKKQQSENGVNNKALLVTLMKQINLLHETNSKIFRNLHETKGKWVMCSKLFCYVRYKIGVQMFEITYLHICS